MALQVFMILFFWLSVALLIGAVLCAVWLFRKKKNLTKGLLTALALLFGSVVAMRMAAGGLSVHGGHLRRLRNMPG